MTADIVQASVELRRILAILAADVEAARVYGQSDASPFAHRTLFRTYFALIEGLCYNMRRVCLRCAEVSPDIFSHEEVVLLREQRFVLNEKGMPEAKVEFARTLPNILFSLRCYAKAYGAAFEPDTSGRGWAAMRQFVEIRNGLVHPKASKDLELSEDQILKAMMAAEWWKATVLELMEACCEAEARYRANGP